MTDQNKKIFWATVVSALLLLAGCSGMGGLSDIDRLPMDKSVVFGKLTLFDDGELLPWDSAAVKETYYLVIMPLNQPWSWAYKIQKDGFFSWALDPGTYAIIGVVSVFTDVTTHHYYNYYSAGAYRQGQSTVNEAQMQLKFAVPDGAPSVHLGELRIKAKNRHIAYDVLPQHPDIKYKFKARFPTVKSAPINSSLIPIPIGHYNAIENICDNRWGVTCSCKISDEITYTYQITGVQPSWPRPFYNPVETNSLLPLFRWLPSKAQNVQYDLIVYEAVDTFGIGATEFVGDSVPGKIVFYKEGLTEPECRLESALKAGTNYFWSVRLRRNNIVSNWSKMSTTFRVEAVEVHRLNQMYKFKTPSDG